MPELAEVEVARTRVERWWAGRAAEDVRVHDPEVCSGVEPEELEEVLMGTVEAVRRRGKYLIVDFEGEDTHAVFHFRMTGKITCHDQPSRRFTRLSWLVPEVGWLVFDDARRLGGLVLVEGDPEVTHEPLAQMGPEPHELADGEALAARLGASRRRLKGALLDQSIIAGVGNIAISELFWRCELPPLIKCHELTAAQRDALVTEMPAYFDWLVEDQMADEIIYLGEGKATNPFSAYGREEEPCPRCQTPIARATFGGRSTYYCPACQRADDQG